MSTPHRIVVTHPREAEKAKDHFRIGRYFVFIDDPIAVNSGERVKRRLERLLIQQSRKIIPLIKEKVVLNGLEIMPDHPVLNQMACLVTDRDLYRAHTDPVRLFIALPGPESRVRLVVHYQNEPLLDREATPSEGVAVETLAGLSPGRYSARLFIHERPAAGPVIFTVADYQLAPLSARLMSHSLDREHQTLTFELQVESYNLPFEGDLSAELIENNRTASIAFITCKAAGRYAGKTRMSGDGPFRLRITARKYPDRVAEAALPGSRKAERTATVISEFGREVFFSLMPEPDALPVRGGFVTHGEELPTGLVVSEVVTDHPRIQATVDLSSLVLVIVDFHQQVYRVQTVGDLTAGSEVAVDADGPVNTVIAGCLIGGKPFEGYTTFLRPSRINLSLEMDETKRPRETLGISIRCDGPDAPIPVLLSVRDERLTAADPPQTALAASLKRCIDDVVTGMEDSIIQPGGPVVEEAMPVRHRGPVWAEEADIRVFTSRPTPEYAAEPETMLAMDTALTARRKTLFADPQSAFSLEASKAPQPPPGPIRTEFPEVLYYGLVTVRGQKEVAIPLQDTLGAFTVEAFALHEGDWTQDRSRFVVDQPVRIDLELPQAVFPGDTVTGRLRAATPSGRARIALVRNGEALRLRTRGPDGAILLQTDSIDTPIELDFDVEPGEYRAQVEDLQSGESDTVEAAVEIPGKIVSYAKAVHLLSPGETLDRSGPDTVSLRLLPTLEEPFQLLVKATAGYGHLCCEQTAAKILSAVLMYMTAEDDTDRLTAEQIILAGIEREKKMFHPSKGFSMYPGRSNFSNYYGPQTVRYLWGLRPMANLKELSPKVREELREAGRMAKFAGKAYNMKPVPDSIQTFPDAYAAVSFGEKHSESRAFVEAKIDFTEDPPALKHKRDAVRDRADLAYASAVLFALGDLPRGLRLANPVVKQFNAQGRLYSTLDSVAAISLMVQLRQSGVISGSGRMAVNGKEMDFSKAMVLNAPVETVRSIEGVAVVEEIRRLEEDWDQFGTPFPVTVQFLNPKGQEMTGFEAGARADLFVSLPKGYETGDLLHVCLPPALAWIEGGAKVQRFTLDFEGRNAIHIPVVVTEKVGKTQHFALCVRNMFSEERASAPDKLVFPPRSSLTDRIKNMARLSR